MEDYKEVVRAKIRENRQTRGYQTLLAGAAGCQRSYLSQVLNSHVHLTLDQAAGLAQFWTLGEDETERFIGRVELARAGTPALRRVIERRLEQVRRRREDLSRRFERAEALPGESELLYYSTWVLSAVHVALSVPSLRTARALAQRLTLPLESVERALSTLERLGVIARAGGESWKVVKSDLHLSRGSQLARTHHGNWRQKVLMRLQEGPDDTRALHYTGVHALSRVDAEKIRELLAEALERARKVVAPSPEETVVAVLVDCFAF